MTVSTDERLGKLEVTVGRVEDDILEMKNSLGEIRKGLAGRPTWAITFALTLLTSTCGVLATALIQATS